MAEHEADSDQTVRVPKLVPDMANVRVVSCGRDHTIVVTTKAEAFSWGSNHHGQLGRETHGQRFMHLPGPIDVGGLIHTVGCGDEHTLLSDKNGCVYSCGSGEQGNLGHGDEDAKTVPLRLNFFLREGLSAIAVFACANSSAAIVTSQSSSSSGSDGSGSLDPYMRRLYCWGGNSDGHLGLGDSEVRHWPCIVDDARHVLDVGLGEDHMHALVRCRDGEGDANFGAEILSWGRSASGRLGLGFVPVLVATPAVLRIQCFVRRVRAHAELLHKVHLRHAAVRAEVEEVLQGLVDSVVDHAVYVPGRAVMTSTVTDPSSSSATIEVPQFAENEKKEEKATQDVEGEEDLSVLWMDIMDEDNTDTEQTSVDTVTEQTPMESMHTYCHGNETEKVYHNTKYRQSQPFPSAYHFS